MTTPAAALIHAVEPPMIQLEGWMHRYPENVNYRSSGLGYSSDMVDLALRRDDPEAFLYFMRLAGCGRNG